MRKHTSVDTPRGLVVYLDDDFNRVEPSAATQIKKRDGDYLVFLRVGKNAKGKAYEETKHPRAPKGHPQGGEWANKPDIAFSDAPMLKDTLFEPLVRAAKTINAHMPGGKLYGSEPNKYNLQTLKAFVDAAQNVPPGAWFAEHYAPARAAIAANIVFIVAGQFDKVAAVPIIMPAQKPAALDLPPQPVANPLEFLPPQFPQKTEVPAEAHIAASQLLAQVAVLVGAPQEEVLDALSQPASVKQSERSEIRSLVENAIYEQVWERKDAILDVMALHDVGENDTFVKSIAQGSAAAKALSEYASTPLYDLQSLSEIYVSSEAVHGQALCDVTKRSVRMGATSASGDYRHELGHAVHFAMAKSYVITSGSIFPSPTPLTNAVDAHFASVQGKISSDPSGKQTKLTHEWYEQHYGIIGRRGADNAKEDFAEHYRGYQREVFRDRTGQGNDVKGGGSPLAPQFKTRLEQYRAYHPEMARVFDAHYTAAWLARALKG